MNHSFNCSNWLERYATRWLEYNVSAWDGKENIAQMQTNRWNWSKNSHNDQVAVTEYTLDHHFPVHHVTEICKAKERYTDNCFASCVSSSFTCLRVKQERLPGVTLNFFVRDFTSPAEILRFLVQKSVQEVNRAGGRASKWHELVVPVYTSLYIDDRTSNQSSVRVKCNL